MSETGKSIAVIGAGIVGVSTAIWAQRMGHRVTLFDREAPGAGTSFGNAGLLAAMAVVPVPTPGILRKLPGMLLDPNQPLFLRPGHLLRALPFLARYVANGRADRVETIAAALATLLTDTGEQHEALAKGTPAEQFLKRGDLLYVYTDRAAYEEDAYAWDLRARNGIDHLPLNHDALAAYDPAMARTCRYGALLRDHGHISDPGAYTRALADHMVAQGGAFVRMTIDHLPQPGAPMETPIGALTFDEVVLTAGAWSTPLARQLGLRVPMDTERGYHVEFINPSTMPRSAVMVTSGKFGLTPMEGRLRAAGIVEIGGLKAPPSKAPVALLKRHVERILPDLTYDRIDSWMGHRPVTADSLPFIGQMAPGLWAGFGHQHIGLTGGPKTGRWLAQMISGSPPNTDLRPYAPNRFG
ncbi:MAG: NAD(P)/FAD-dependent oxidoreductase [Brevirhabdus sp.]